MHAVPSLEQQRNGHKYSQPSCSCSHLPVSSMQRALYLILPAKGAESKLWIMALKHVENKLVRATTPYNLKAVGAVVALSVALTSCWQPF